MNILSLVLVLLSTLRLRAFAFLAAWRAARLIRRYRARAPRNWDCYATGAPVSPTQEGVTTVVWGTIPGGTSVLPVTTGANVTRLSITTVNGEPVGQIENGDGALLTSVFLPDGFNAEGEMVYDTAKTYPATPATNIALTLPKAIDVGYGAVHSVFPGIIESFGAVFERKKEAMISFRYSWRPGRDGAPTT